MSPLSNGFGDLWTPEKGLQLGWKHHRHAGARRVRFGRELAHHLFSLGRDEWRKASETNFLPGIAGASQQVIFGTGAAAALTTAQVTYIGPLTGIPQAPLILCLHYCPQLASVTATATITLQMRRTDVPAVISNCVKLAGTTDTNPGPITMVGYLPLPSTTTTRAMIPAGSGIDVQGANTSGSAVPTGSATAPITLGAFGIT